MIWKRKIDSAQDGEPRFGGVSRQCEHLREIIARPQIDAVQEKTLAHRAQRRIGKYVCKSRAKHVDSRVVTRSRCDERKAGTAWRPAKDPQTRHHPRAETLKMSQGHTVDCGNIRLVIDYHFQAASM
jgi:hypothetical protein